jgi:cytochrome bd ubiquinol oxidase subunit I
VIMGWVTAEVGRQPYVIYGVLRTADAVSPLSGATVAWSLATFVVAYAIIFGAGTYYLLRLIAKGPGALGPIRPERPDKTARRPLSVTEDRLETVE